MSDTQGTESLLELAAELEEVAPHVVGPWYALPPPGMDQWEVTLGTMLLTINANSHQSAKRVAVSHWATCSADPDSFRRAIVARIAEKWRGGIKSRRIVRHNAEVSRPAPKAAQVASNAGLGIAVPVAPTLHKTGSKCLETRAVAGNCGGAEFQRKGNKP